MSVSPEQSSQPTNQFEQLQIIRAVFTETQMNGEPFWIAEVPNTCTLPPDKILNYLRIHHRTMNGLRTYWKYTSGDATFPPADKYVFNGKVGQDWVKTGA